MFEFQACSRPKDLLGLRRAALDVTSLVRSTRCGNFELRYLITPPAIGFQILELVIVMSFILNRET